MINHQNGKPSQWLGFTISDLLYLNFTDIDQFNFHEKAKELLEKINSCSFNKSVRIFFC